MGQTSEFPAVSEFLEKMQIKKSMFGYDKEDVYLKMQQLNRLYQEQLFLVKGQVESARAEAEQMRRDAEQLKIDAGQRVEELKEEIRETERAAVLKEMREQNSVLRKELELLEDEINRSVVQLNGLRERVNQMTEEL